MGGLLDGITTTPEFFGKLARQRVRPELSPTELQARAPWRGELLQTSEVLPFGIYAQPDGTKRASWAVPGILRGDEGGLANPAAVYGDDQAAADRNVGRVGIGNALGLTSARAFSPVPQNALGIFGGRLAKTADQGALAKAEALEKSGTPREQIWNDTGWFRGVDGKWRFEIDDSKAVVYPSTLELTGKSEHGKPLRDVMDHYGYVSAYPDARDLNVQRMSGKQFPEKANSGAYDPSRNAMWFDGASPDRGRNIALHELDHDAQIREGFAFGGKNPNLAGEVSARAVMSRRDLTPEQRRARAPWLDYDVPESQQIVRGLMP